MRQRARSPLVPAFCLPWTHGTAAAPADCLEPPPGISEEGEK
ncbi:hypothetical protein ACP70R_018814 [Stipagrostis hirtigluma subsp. patula]